ncbi:MAG: hypothetical protein UE295_06525 [Acutalibacteraceae bacterium]|nr:hypothetical protein [Acutalibacteraceae bacterium]
MEHYLKRMSKEHEKLFPLATLGTQMLKLEEELEECENADDIFSVQDELADGLLVSCGIYRFAPKSALLVASSIIGTAEHFGFKSILLRKAKEKWEVNKKRKWKYENGIYHHIGEDKYD